MMTGRHGATVMTIVVIVDRAHLTATSRARRDQRSCRAHRHQPIRQSRNPVPRRYRRARNDIRLSLGKS